MADALDSALDRLASALADPSPHEATWREAGIEFEGRLGAWAGRPSPDAIALVAREHEEVYGVPLDPSLRRFWNRFDGIAVGERFPGAPTGAPGEIAWADLAAIGEPVLWPVDRHGRHFEVADIHAGDRRLFAFGELADSGWLALAVGTSGPPLVVWQDIEANLVPPHVIANDLAKFLGKFVDADLRLQRLLRTMKTPGWGE